MNSRWLGVFGVPAIGARALGTFRALLGFGFLFILLNDPIRAVARADQRAYSPLADFEWVHNIAASEVGAFTLQLVGCASAALFALGIRARLSYVVLVAVLLLHATMLLVRRGVHDWDLAIVTLLGLLAVPWGNAPPLLQLYRDRRRSTLDDPVSRASGFAIWLPGLTLGLAYAAAAYAKLSLSGFEWITSGAVKYHFVDDGRNAPFVLGLWVAAHPAVAVVISLFAVLVEATFIVVVFITSWRLRALVGAAGFGLMAAFYVFQGVRWWPWLILFFAFLPWYRHQGAHSGEARHDLTWVHAGVVAVLVSAQAFASYRRIEIEPLLSNYPMYSHTYGSPESFDHTEIQVRFASGGVDITDRVEIADGEDTLYAIAKETTEKGSPTDASLRELAEFRQQYAGRYGKLPAAIDLFVLRNPFDWERGRYLPPVTEWLGTVQLATGIIDGGSSRSGGARRDP